MPISYEADRLVYGPGLAGQKIASDDEPRFTLSATGLFFANPSDFCLGASAVNG
jgi:hypothetical protein